MKRLTLPFNINNTVWVQLTDLGRKILAENEYGPYPYDEDEDGWSKWQLWELMQLFGSYMANGATAPFKTNIRVIHEFDT